VTINLLREKAHLILPAKTPRLQGAKRFSHSFLGVLESWRLGV
jgi:hypothetical protein